MYTLRILVESAFVSTAIWYVLVAFPFPALHFVYELY